MPELTWNAPGLTWNQPGLTWNGTAPTTKRKTMKIKLALKTLTELERIAKTRQYATNMLANAAIYGSAVPDAAALNAAADAAEAAITTQTAKQQLAEAATTAKDAAVALMDDAVTKAASWTEDNVPNAADIEKVFTLQKERTATTSIPQVTDLAATIGDKTGEVDLSWDRILKASSYEIQCRLAGATDWTHAKITTASSTTIKNLTSGALYQFRVRAIGPNDLEGEWSDLAEKRAA
ncbi:MAG: hypothetical protein RL088_2939 [Verrucomicrobiota bacterium]|jgi:hypothetical protein